MLDTKRLISFDWAIKKILRNRDNFDILEGFLSEFLNDDIKVLSILEDRLLSERTEDKYKYLILKVENYNHEPMIIELQYNKEPNYLKQILHSFSKVVAEYVRVNDNYSKIISITILNFDFGDGDDYIYKSSTNFIGLHNKKELKLNEKQKELYQTDSVEDIYPQHYLIKLRNFNDVIKTPLDEWIYFLKNEKIIDNPKAKGLAKASEKLDYIKMEKDERLAYNRYQEHKKHENNIYESTYVIGELIGVKKEKMNIAKKLLDAKVDIDTIKLTTGLSEDELKSIIQGD